MKSSSSLLKRLLRLVAYLFGAVVVLIVFGGLTAYTVAHTRLTRKHVVQAAAVTVTSDAAAIARGRHLAMTRGCLDCHGKDFGGAKVVDDPLIGKLHGPNLTQGKGGVPSDYMDMDYIRAIRHGVDRTGRALMLMPSQEYAMMSDEDIGSLVAYLKSVPSVDRERGPVAPGPLAYVLLAVGEIKLAAAEIDHGAARPVRVAEGVTVDYGRYLSATCAGCHGNNFSGGKIPGGAPHWPPAANLTSFAGTGMSTWSQEQFRSVLRTMKRPDGSTVDPAMPAGFGLMTDDELSALWLYLKSLPAAPLGQRQS